MKNVNKNIVFGTLCIVFCYLFLPFVSLADATTTCSYSKPYVAAQVSGEPIVRIVSASSTATSGNEDKWTFQWASSTCITIQPSSGGAGGSTDMSVVNMVLISFLWLVVCFSVINLIRKFS